MMRHLYIIVDMSESMKAQDIKPTRLLIKNAYLSRFTINITVV